MARRFGLRLWRPNRGVPAMFDIRAEDAEAIISSSVKYFDKPLISGEEPLSFLAKTLWDSIALYAGNANIVANPGSMMLYIPTMIQYDDDIVKKMSTERLAAFVFAAFTIIEYLEVFSETGHFKIDLALLKETVLSRSDFTNKDVFNRWLCGSVSLFSKLAPGQNREASHRSSTKQLLQIQSDGEDGLSGEFMELPF